MRENGMHAGFRFDRRVGVQFIIYLVAFYWNCQQVRIGNRIERIARFLCAHSAAHGSEVIAICQGEEHYECVEKSW